MKPKARLKDIAAKTGYGTNTVSLALRGSTRISAAARELIKKTAVELEYVPNHFAKSLVSRKSKTIGLILHEITNPILTGAARTIQLVLASKGYSVLFATSNGNIDDEMKSLRMFHERMVDGILIYPVMHTQLDHLQRLRQQNFPIVLLVGVRASGIDAIGIDEFAGAYDATRHLIDQGHRKIGALAPTAASPHTKYEGFLAAMLSAGLPVDAASVVRAGDHSIEGGIAATDAIMRRPDRPTAIFASSDILALGALRWARINNLAVPYDLAIIGFDNIDSARFAVTPLSTINNDVEELAALSVARLLELIAADGSLPPPRTTLLHGHLVVRESTTAEGARHPASVLDVQ